MTKRAFDEYVETKTQLGPSFFRSLVLTVQTSIVKDLNKKLAKKRKVLRKLKKAGVIHKTFCSFGYCVAQTYMFREKRYVENWLRCPRCNLNYCQDHWDACAECDESVCHMCMGDDLDVCEDCEKHLEE